MSYIPCIYCGLNLNSGRFHSLENATDDMLKVLYFSLHPTPLSRKDRLCFKCYFNLQIISEKATNKSETLEFGHQDICFGCGASIATTTSFAVPAECPERDVILKWTFPHLVKHIEKVCYACWMNAKSTADAQAVSNGNGCTISTCTELTNTHKPRQKKSTEILEITLPDVHVPVIQETPVSESSHEMLEQNNVILKSYRRVASTSSHCVFLNCQYSERLLVPAEIRAMVLQNHKIYIPHIARVCKHHLNNCNWNKLTGTITEFTSVQIDNMLSVISTYQFDLTSVESLPPYIFDYFYGMNYEQFQKLFNFASMLRDEVYRPKRALCIYLVKLKTEHTIVMLSKLFKIPTSTIINKIKKTKFWLTKQLEESNLSIQQVINTEQGILEESEVKKNEQRNENKLTDDTIQVIPTSNVLNVISE